MKDDTVFVTYTTSNLKPTSESKQVGSTDLDSLGYIRVITEVSVGWMN